MKIVVTAVFDELGEFLVMTAEGARLPEQCLRELDELPFRVSRCGGRSVLTGLFALPTVGAR